MVGAQHHVRVIANSPLEQAIILTYDGDERVKHGKQKA